MDIVENISATVGSSLEGIYSNKTASAVIGLFLVLYAGLAAPKLPKSVAKMFGNSAFRLVILFLVAYMSSRNTSIAIIATVALVISMQTLSYHEANEKVHQQIEEEVMMEAEEELEGEEEVLDTEEADNLMEEENSLHEGNYHESGEFAEFHSEQEHEHEHEHEHRPEEHAFKPEEHALFGEEEEEVVGNHMEEVYASVGEENGLLMEEKPEEERMAEEIAVRPEEMMAEEVYGEQEQHGEEEEVHGGEEMQELRAQPEKSGYVFDVTGYSGSEFATY